METQKEFLSQEVAQLLTGLSTVVLYVEVQSEQQVELALRRLYQSLHRDMLQI